MKIEKIYNLTPLQKGILSHNVSNPDSIAYFEQATLYFYEDINIDLLKISLELVQKRYEALRTSIYYRVTDCPKQVVFKERTLDFAYEDLIQCEQEERQHIIEHYKKDNMKRGFDLEKDNLMRIKLFKESTEKSTMVWSFHHIIVDGWSIAIIMEKMISYYLRLIEGDSKLRLLEEIEVEKSKERTFKYYVSKLYAQDTDKGIKYWSRLLGDYKNAAEIPLVREINKTKEQVDEIECLLPEDFTNKLIKYSETMNLTISNILEMAWGITLQHFSGLDDVVFGKLVSGRNLQIAGIEKIVGMLMNTIPVRVKTDNNCTIKEMLMHLQKESIEGSKFHYCDLSMIQSKTKAKGDLIKSLYVYENVFIDNSYYDTIRKINIGNEELVDQVEYPLMFCAMMAGNNLKLYITYNPQYYLIEEIELVLMHLRTILNEVVEDSLRKVIDISRVDSDEKAKTCISGKEFSANNLQVWNMLCERFLLEDQELDHLAFKIISKHNQICGNNKPGEICIEVLEQSDTTVKKNLIKTNILGRWDINNRIEILKDAPSVKIKKIM